MSDGSSLRNSWHSALKDAESRFKRFYTSSPPSEWKRISSSNENGGSSSKAKLASQTSRILDSSDVVIHRNVNKTGDDVYRLVLDVPLPLDEPLSLEPWHAVLATPELRKEWDPAVEQSQFMEMFDWTTKICKTNFTLGWPANPRDAVTICRTYHDTSTVIYIATSLPRSSDEPAYLRPSPPYVRSNVTLFAWCIQHVQPQLPSSAVTSRRSSISLVPKLRITCFYQHDLKSLWSNSSSTFSQQLSTMMLGLLKTVNTRKARVPVLVGFGNSVSLDRMKFRIDREALDVDYCIIPPEDDTDHKQRDEYAKGIEEVREQRRLVRSVEFVLPASEGWDVQITTKASSESVESLPWSAHAFRRSSFGGCSSMLDQILLKITHSPLPDEHAVLRVRLVVEISASSSKPSAIGLRLNGLPQTVKAVEERDPSTMRYLPLSGLDLGPQVSTTDMSVSEYSASSASSSMKVRPVHLGMSGVERSAAAEKSVLSRVKRNYIYFSSLLQEPEAKWRHTTDARGVSITQLDSIDPTLVVYRAEATFVGVSMWDLYSALVSPGAKIIWDKLHDDYVLLEDVNELTELWQYKSKPAWPSNGRDSVVLRTVYKSPTTIHVFSFSISSDPADNHLFPTVPPPEPGIIRTQIDLQGWAIEALSPTTTALTLLEQSDPKGWANKTTAPGQMVNTLAGIGEFAIKYGGPPLVTRLAGARKRDVKYDHEKYSFRVEYEGAVGRRAGSSSPTSLETTPSPQQSEQDTSVNAGACTDTTPLIECEIRCDMDTWASSLDIVIDPPPHSVSCLKRHRVSAAGGGLWVTIVHDAVFVGDERVLVIVRRGTGIGSGGIASPSSSSRSRSGNLVMVNGARVQVDAEEMADSEIRTLSRMRRVKPPRIPLDQPPVVGIVRRKRAEWDKDQDSPTGEDSPVKSKADSSTPAAGGGWASAPKISSPLSRFFTYAVDQATISTQQAVAAITPGIVDEPIPPLKAPMQFALEALSWTQRTYSRSIPVTPATPSSTTTIGGWTPVSDKQGVSVRRSLDSRISRSLPVHRGEKVIQGVSAEELLSVVAEYECRKQWDDRLDQAIPFQSFGGGSGTAYLTYKTGFPFRDRGFYVSTVSARMAASTASGGGGAGPAAGDTGTGSAGVNGIGGKTSSSARRNVSFYVSSSFHPDSAKSFSAGKYNPYSLPTGRIFVDSWVLETLDPYTKENYAIPSTRCTRYVAVDYAGSIPAAMNTMINATLPRTSIVGVENYLRGNKERNGVQSPPMTRLPGQAFVLAVDSKIEKEEEEEEGYGDGDGSAEGDDVVRVGWRVRKRDENRVLVSTKFEPGTKVYKSKVILGMPSTSKSLISQQAPSTTPTPSNSTGTAKSSQLSRRDSSNQTTPRPSRIALTDQSFVAPSNASSNSSSISASDAGPTDAPPLLHPGSGGTSSSSSLRGRSSSSAFTIKGEIRQSTDLIVGEIVLDSNLYPTGYDIKIRSRLVSLPRQQQSRQGAGHLPLGFASADAAGLLDEDESRQLPISYAVYTLPSTPLHASASDDAPRHLIRMTLPTAQYQHQIAVVEDPLTGETRSGVPRPDWLVDMQDKGVQAIVDVEVKPVVALGGGVAVTGKMKSRGGEQVMGEKESLTRLGRDELLDDRVWRMSVLTRFTLTADGEQDLSDGLKSPVGTAVDLLDTQSLASGAGGNSSSQSKSQSMWAGRGGPEDETKSLLEGDDKSLVDSSVAQMVDFNRTPHSSSTSPMVSSSITNSSTGLLGFFHSNPLSRFTTSSLSLSGKGAPGSSSGTASIASSRRSSMFGGSTTPVRELPGGLDLQDMRGLNVLQDGRQRRYFPLSTVIIVGLISFLIGSLLRSLLSPADFVYVIDGGGQDTDGGKYSEEGWRELRRLVEIKYAYGGWDLQIGVVRRH